MISNQILQNTIDGLKGITRIDLCIIDVEGKILAATFPDADRQRTGAVAHSGMVERFYRGPRAAGGAGV